jgi:GDPmannose 4,6-dehydratase
MRRLARLRSWEGEGLDEVGVDAKSGKVRVRVDPAYFRPTEVETLLGDPTKCREVLKWTHKVPFDTLVKEMVASDIVLTKKGDNNN